MNTRDGDVRRDSQTGVSPKIDDRAEAQLALLDGRALASAGRSEKSRGGPGERTHGLGPEDARGRVERDEQRPVADNGETGRTLALRAGAGGVLETVARLFWFLAVRHACEGATESFWDGWGKRGEGGREGWLMLEGKLNTERGLQSPRGAS